MDYVFVSSQLHLYLLWIVSLLIIVYILIEVC